MNITRIGQCSRPIAIFFAMLGSLLSGAAARAATIDFETDNAGNPTVYFAPIGNAYSALGITFTNGEYFQCHGGCPPPATGTFATSADLRSPMTVFEGPFRGRGA